MSMRLLRYSLGIVRKNVNTYADAFYFYRRFAFVVLFAAPTVYTCRTYLYDLPTSAGPSMCATIPDETNALIVDRMHRNGRGIKVGDVVQVRSPIHRKQNTGKRVLAVAGDYVLRSKKESLTPGNIPVSGITDWESRLAKEQLRDPKLPKKEGERLEAVIQREQDAEWDEPEMIRIPEGHVWIEGDNMAWSRDSRQYGPVPTGLILGRSNGYMVNLFNYTTLNAGKGLRKVEDWEMGDVLGTEPEKGGMTSRKVG